MTILTVDDNGLAIESALETLGVNGFNKPGGTDKATDHSYAPVYAALMRLIPEPSTLVEVGVYHGGSMLLWQSIFPSTQIIGVDCSNHVHQNVTNKLDTKRTSLVIGNAYHQNTVDKIIKLAQGSIDVVIDDGPHTLGSQANFLDLYGQLIVPGGVAIIEDIASLDWLPTLESKVPNGWEYQTLDLRNKKGRADDIMFIMRRPPINDKTAATRKN
jgi:hypothetical protein